MVKIDISNKLNIFQVSAAPCISSVAKKPEIPLHSLVIKPEKPTPNVLPANNNPANGQPGKR